MTSEVAILNRSAVALAADSAITSSYWDPESASYKTRYTKGANKLFNLSASQPVAMMIYGSATCQGVPWEVLAKSYRDTSRGRVFKSVDGYAEDFFAFVECHKNIFSPDFLRRQYVSDVSRTAWHVLLGLRETALYKDATASGKSGDGLRKAFAVVEDNVTKLEHLPRTDGKLFDEVHRSTEKIIIETLAENSLFTECKNELDLTGFARTAAQTLFKADSSNLSETGLVFAGYGEDDFFPSVRNYICRGHLLQRLVQYPKKDGAADVSQDNESAVMSYAKNEMITTFRLGMTFTNLVKLDQIFEGSANSVLQQLKEVGALAPEFDTGPIVEKAKEQFGNDVLDHFRDRNHIPLRRALGTLSISELADLAETLVSLESLKERVTQHSDSVSGPIDVAVVSKSDGFIWIKRKHYFDPKLNNRYFVRLDNQ